MRVEPVDTSAEHLLTLWPTRSTTQWQALSASLLTKDKKMGGSSCNAALLKAMNAIFGVV